MNLNKYYVYDENNKPVAVQITIEIFERLEKVIEKIYKSKEELKKFFTDEEREMWNDFSAQNLGRAYSSDEIEYPLSMIKEKNEEYGK